MDKKPSRLTPLRDAALITASTSVTTAMGLVASMFIARSLGPDQYGQYAYMVWLAGLLVAFCNHGLCISGIRFLSEYRGRSDDDTARSVHGWLHRWQQISTSAVAVVFSVVCWWLPIAGWESMRAIFVGMVLVSVAARASCWFDVSMAKGYRLFTVESATNAIMGLAYAGGVLVLTALHAKLLHFALLFTVVSVLYAVMARWLLIRRDVRPLAQPCPPQVQERIRQHLTWSIILVAVATLSNKTMETFLLGVYASPRDVGYFTIAATLTKGGIDLLSSALTAMLMPMMAHAYGEGGHQKANEILGNAVRYFLFFGIVIGGVGSIWSEAGISILYGHKYLAVAPVLQVMVVVCGITLPEGAFGSLMSTTDNQRLRATIASLSVVFSSLAALALVPKYGLMGALMSHASSRVVIFLFTAVSVKRSLNATFPMGEISRLILAAVVPGAVCWMIMANHPAVWAQLATGVLFVVMFLVSTLVLRTWTALDAEVALALAQRQPALLGRLTPMLTRWAASLR